MKIPVRLSEQSPWRKVIAMLVIALIATVAAAGARRISFVGGVGHVFYDAFYRQRPAEDRTGSSTVLIKVDQASLDFFDHQKDMQRFGWPWPRDFWALIITYLQQCGARCVVFDIGFTETSQYQKEMLDDSTLAETLDSAKIPIVFGEVLDEKGKEPNFAPPVKHRQKFGVANMSGTFIREYSPMIDGLPSLAVAALEACGEKIGEGSSDQFLLHFYGPSGALGNHTFRYLPAYTVIAAGFDPKHDHGISAKDFKGKIVLIGGVAAGTYDLKESPWGSFPGVELHATAIENLLFGQRVHPVPGAGLLALTALVSLGASAGSLFPRKLWIKFGIGAVILAVMILAARQLFLQYNIRWLDPTAPILATVLAIILSLGWSYFAEDRQARFFLKALGQYLSPHVAAELRNQPDKLSLSTESRELTVFFSDIADFTTMSERLGDGIGPLLNFYLDEMSNPVLESDGTLDKYIGDAIVCFWNAPLQQEDHAQRACLAALAMRKRLTEIRPRLSELGAGDLDCRIGINTGLVRFGNMGSSKKFNYSVIGDAVNFASRLEGANKFYDTRIMLGEATANIVRGKFVLRKLDVLQVKGKVLPATVFELLGEGPATAQQTSLVRQYESAFEKYQAQDWSEAERILLDVLEKFSDDGPSQVLLKRVRAYRDEPPGAKWDGVYIAESK